MDKAQEKMKEMASLFTGAKTPMGGQIAENGRGKEIIDLLTDDATLLEDDPDSIFGGATYVFDDSSAIIRYLDVYFIVSDGDISKL